MTIQETEISIQPHELQKWTQAYRDDVKLKAAYETVCRDGTYKQYSLTSTGLMQIQKGDQQKVVVPLSMRQQVIEECHDVPTAGHVGMRRTMELIDKRFHWRGLQGDVITYVKDLSGLPGDEICQLSQGWSPAAIAHTYEKMGAGDNGPGH